MRAAILAAVACLAIILAGCGPSGPTGSTGATGPVPTGEISSPVVGIVIQVDGAGLNEIRAFDLQTAEGQRLSLRVGTLENPAEFPPGHLREHQATGSPVRIFFRPKAGELVVYRIEDAG